MEIKKLFKKMNVVPNPDRIILKDVDTPLFSLSSTLSTVSVIAHEAVEGWLITLPISAFANLISNTRFCVLAECPKCHSDKLMKYGKDYKQRQIFYCKKCDHRFNSK